MFDREIKYVDVTEIIPNRFQPRLTFDPSHLKELAISIKEHGIIQPLVLRKLNNKYEIIAGERRYKASRLIGLKTVPAIILNIDDNESAEVAIVENIQRQQLSPLEEARSYKKLLDRGYLTQEELSKKMGKSQSFISNKLRLLHLSDPVQEALLQNKISERHARSLLSIKNPNVQEIMLNNIIKNKMTVKQTDDEIKKIINNESTMISNTDLNSIVIDSKEISQDEVIANTNRLLKDSGINPNDVYKAKFNSESTFNSNDKRDFEDQETNMSFGAEVYSPNNITFDEKYEVERKEIKEEVNNNSIQIEDINKNIMKSTFVSNDIRTAINTVRNCVATLEKYGFKVECEEFDFENIYQIILKLDKK